MLYNLKLIVFINVCIVSLMLNALRLRKGTFVFHQLLQHGAEMPANLSFFDLTSARGMPELHLFKFCT